jgi:hypothetical protein
MMRNANEFQSKWPGQSSVLVGWRDRKRANAIALQREMIGPSAISVGYLVSDNNTRQLTHLLGGYRIKWSGH